MEVSGLVFPGGNFQEEWISRRKYRGHDDIKYFEMNVVLRSRAVLLCIV